jgi:uncharacterized tellurite resistance protein B-like protein
MVVFATMAKNPLLAPLSPKDQVGSTLLAAMSVAMIADGVIAPAERALLMQLAREGLFGDIDVDSVIQRAIERCVEEGRDVLLGELADELRSDDEREAMFSACIAIVATDGKITESEARMLRSLYDLLELPRARLDELAGPLRSLIE